VVLEELYDTGFFSESRFVTLKEYRKRQLNKIKEYGMGK